MRNALCVLALAATVACSENGVSGEREEWADPNPIDVGGEYVEDQYVQSSPTEADVLFVISNWWSMEQAYAELVDSFDSLLEVFIGSGMNYHFGVISTDTDHTYDRGRLKEADGLRFIDTDTPSPIETFAEMATMDASGCVGPRRPRDATYMALEFENDKWNKGFRRPQASLHTVFVSDDRDVSVMASVDEFVGWYNTHTETPEIDTLSTIVDFNKDSMNLTVTDRIGGSSHPIEQMPWANVLNEIGLRAQGLRREYFLSSTPLEGTIVVNVLTPQGAELEFTEGALEEGGDFGYDSTRNSIRFHEFEPAANSKITIGYNVL